MLFRSTRQHVLVFGEHLRTVAHVENRTLCHDRSQDPHVDAARVYESRKQDVGVEHNLDHEATTI